MAFLLALALAVFLAVPSNAPCSNPSFSNSLAQLELQIVTALFFRYFEVELAPEMKPSYMEMAALFTGSPKSEKVLLSLKRDLC